MCRRYAKYLLRRVVYVNSITNLKVDFEYSKCKYQTFSKKKIFEYIKILQFKYFLNKRIDILLLKFMLKTFRKMINNV